MKKTRRIIIVLVLVVAAGVVAGNLWLRGEDEAYEFFTSSVTRGDIQNTIAATGNVEAMVMVEVGAQVTGQVTALYADFNSVVTQGQLLAQLDPKQVQTQLRNVQANLRSAQSRIGTAEADLENARTSVLTSQANLDQARADLELAERNYKRSQDLFADSLVAETEVENTETSLRSARVRVQSQEASLQQAQTQILSRQAAIEQANAALEQAQADLEEAQLNVEYTEIRSPVDGVVISREVDVGQTVSASTSAPTLFLIANDLGRMRVQAAIDEADIGLMGQNNEVTFRVDAYPNDEFTGNIEEIRLNPSTSQNVVTYSVIITFDNPDLKLKPGMTANITILVDKREGVIAVPNTALRYSPPDAETLLAARASTPSAAGAASAAPAPAEGRGFDPAAAAARGGRGRGDFGGRGGRGLPEGFPVPEGFQLPAGLALAGADDTSAGPSATIVAPATSSVYMPGQEWGDGLKIQFQPLPPEPPHEGRVWVQNELGVAEPIDLMVGLTDGSRTEVVSGDIDVGTLVLIGDSSNLTDESGSGSSNTDPRNMMRMLSGGGSRGGWR
jgi:HlyD family secretion protein